MQYIRTINHAYTVMERFYRKILLLKRFLKSWDTRLKNWILFFVIENVSGSVLLVSDDGIKRKQIN